MVDVLTMPGRWCVSWYSRVSVIEAGWGFAFGLLMKLGMLRAIETSFKLQGILVLVPCIVLLVHVAM